jgi:hypothetical protein
MMVISPHDRIAGHAGRVWALDRVPTYAKGKKDPWFAPRMKSPAMCWPHAAAGPTEDVNE